VNAGVNDILIVTGGNHAGEYLPLLGNGSEFGLKHLNYTYQARAGGIAEALGLAEHFIDNDKVIVMLGDNVIEGNICAAVRDFEQQGKGAKILLKEVDNPKEYGVAELNGNRIVRIEEKPAEPKSNLAVIGIYLYDSEVFDIIKTLKPSRRNELEITDVNNAYIERGTMTYDILQGWWGDSGESIDALLRVSNLVAQTGANKVG
jgi:glucose-1-phosphate thymidylyltransferase